jgi:putative redox protein
VTAEGEKLRDGVENHLGDIEITFTVRFPDGAEGDRARERLPKAIAQSRDRLCTVSRTVQRGAAVKMHEG